MQTQKDHVEAYSFLVDRMASALLVGNVSSQGMPARRAWFGMIVGFAVAVLMTLGFLVFGLIRHSSQSSHSTTAPVAAVVWQLGEANGSVTWPR